jgi:hypothetical protein
MKSIFVMKLRFEFGLYMATGVKSLGSNVGIMKEPILFYVYLFIGRIGKCMQSNYLGNKKLPSLIENVISSFLDNRRLYQNEICPKALPKIMGPILNSGMVCLSIFDGGIVTYIFPSKSKLRI